MVVSTQSMQKTGKQVTIPLNQSALNWLLDRNGCKPGEKIFDMTCLSTCDRCIKKMAAGGDLYTVGKLLVQASINSTQVYAKGVCRLRLKP